MRLFFPQKKKRRHFRDISRRFFFPAVLGWGGMTNLVCSSAFVNVQSSATTLSCQSFALCLFESVILSRKKVYLHLLLRISPLLEMLDRFLKKQIKLHQKIFKMNSIWSVYLKPFRNYK